MDNAHRLKAYESHVKKCGDDGRTPETVDDYLLKWFKVEWCDELDYFERYFCEAWQELRSDAPSGMGLSQIPSTAIRGWMDEEQVPEEQRTFYRAVIRAIDRQYITYKDEEQQAKQSSAKPAKMQRGSVPEVK